MPVTIHPVAAGDLTEAEIARWRKVPVSVAVDLGENRGQIDPAIRPLLPPGQQPRLFGRAVTVHCEPPDFGAVVYAIDLIRPGDVLVIAANGHRETAMIGDILGEHIRRRGAAGLVCDGAIRDVAAMAGWRDFSIFTRWTTPRGPISVERGTINRPVVVGGCSVAPGDLIIGDDDGLVALTPAMVRDRIAKAEAKLALEADWQAQLANNRPVLAMFGLPPALEPEQP